jgi:CubicO group peptidase (beta-lactamase class C family)
MRLYPLILVASPAIFAPAFIAPDSSGLSTARSVAEDGHARIPHVAPESAGMSSTQLARIDEVVRRGINAGGFPGAAVIVGRRGSVVWERGYGTLDWNSGASVSAEQTMYDLASLTKVVATTSAAMVLADRGKLRLDAPVKRYLPSFSGGNKDAVTVRDLLAHRSGLPAGRRLPGAGKRPTAARKAVLATPLVRPPGTRAEYSDLGLDVLGFVIESIAREPLDKFVRREVYRPLGMASTMFKPAAGLRPRIAPTETTRGSVHDGNARALGGVAGHAGLFATAGDLAVYARLMLDGGSAGSTKLFGDSIAREFTKPGPGWRGLGWETCSGGGSCGRYLTPRAFGHTGFTGTSMWVDPELDLFVIVLTNWIHGRASGGVAPVAVLQDVRGDVVDLAVLAINEGAESRSLPWKLRSELQIGWW